MTPHTKAQNSRNNSGSLDVFVCSMIDRGINTAYALRRDGGLSLGSTIPVLSRLETAGYIQKDIVRSGKRLRHTYRLSAAGRKVARSGWKSLLKETNNGDLDHLLRVADLANHYGVPTEEIREFLDCAADRKAANAALVVKQRDETANRFSYLGSKHAFEVDRLVAESNFLRSCALQFSRKATHKPKGRKTSSMS
jgi:DNA-binding PadR family transcriptional regulator